MDCYSWCFCVFASELLEFKYLHIFRSLYVAHCINDILKDVGELSAHKITIEKVKKITVLINCYSLVQSLMRSFIRGRVDETRCQVCNQLSYFEKYPRVQESFEGCV